MAKFVNGETVFGTVFPLQKAQAFSYGTVADSSLPTSVTIGLGNGRDSHRRTVIAFFTPDEAIKFANGLIGAAEATLQREEEAAANEYWATMAEEEEQANLEAMLETNLEEAIARWEEEQQYFEDL